MRFLWLSVILPIVLGSAVPGQEKCVWGPPYWCSSVSHARECGATNHCLQTVWKYEVIKPESTETCTYCELLVNELKDVLADKVTEEKLASVLSNVCAAFPDADIRDTCKGIIIEDVPVLIQMFDNKISTDMICAAVGFCSGLGDNWSPYGLMAGNKNTTCADCLKFVKDVQDSITSNETLSELRQLLNQTVCSQLGSFGDLCNDFLKQYLPLALQAVASQLDPDILCRVFGFCGTKGRLEDVISMKNIFKDHTSEGALQYRSTEECNICKDLVQEIDLMIENQTYQEYLVYDLKTVLCPFTGEFEIQCMHLMDGYALKLIKMVADKMQMDPEITCQIVGLCSSGESSDAEQVVHRVKNLLKVRKSKKVTLQASGEECDICKDVFNQIGDLLRDTTIQARVKYELETVVCPLLGNFEDECKQLVEEYLPMLFELLINELDPTTVCESVGFCTVPSVPEVASVKEMEPAAMVGPGYVQQSVLCTVCEDLLEQVDFILKQNDTINTVEEFVDKVCKRLTTEMLTKQCEGFVAEYGQLVIDLLAKELDPKTICVAIKLCVKPTVAVPKQKDAKCQLCVLMAAEVEALVANISAADLMNYSKLVCSYLPGNLSAVCLKYVNEYGEIVISVLKSKSDPKGLCQLAQLCTATHVPYMTKPIPETLPKLSTPSEECQICGTFFVALKFILENNDTREELKQALVAGCKELPGSISAPCVDIVQVYGDRLIELLASKINANEICEGIGVCTAIQKSVPALSVVMSPYDTLPLVGLPDDKKETKSSEKCSLCDEGMPILLSHIGEHATKEQIQQQVKAFCTEVPFAFRSECDGIIKQYGSKIVDCIVQRMDAHAICVAIGLCDEMPSLSEVMSPYDTLPIAQPVSEKKEPNSAGNAIECEACQFFMNYLDKELQDNKTEENIKAMLKELCGKMPSEIVGECTTFVNKYTLALINYLVLSTSPDEICKILELCPAGTRQLPQPVHVKLLKDNQGSTDVTATVECVLCEFVMKEIDDILQENRSVAAIVSALDIVCSKFPDTISTECKDFVNTYSKTIIGLLLQDLSPKEVCTAIKLCTALTAPTLLEKVKDNSQVEASSTECVLCEFIMKTVDDELKTNKSVAAIISALNRVCSVLPDTISAECKEFVTNYSAAIIQLLVDEADPKTVCTTIGLCTGQTIPTPVEKVKGTGQGVATSAECVLCEFILKTLDDDLKTNATKEEIEAALEKVCSKLPGTLTEQCKSFVAQYGDYVLTLLAGAVKPDQICKTIGLCTSQTRWGTFVKILPEKVKDGTECAICKYICAAAQQFLKENGTKQELETLVKKLCDILPDTVTYQCGDFVDQYIPAILDLLEKNLKPEEICQTVGVCNATVTEKDENTLYFNPHRLVGQNKCTFGPAYWCANKDNAAECNAMEHCMRHVWN